MTSILLITSTPQMTQTIQSALSAQPEYTLLESCPPKADCVESVLALQPDIILFHDDFKDEEGSLRVIDAIASQYFAGSVIPILPKSKVLLTDRIILAGARAIVVEPFPNQNLITTLNRVRELTARHGGSRQDATKPTPGIPTASKSLVIFSPTGGVGCTTVAINLAIALHQQTKEKVMLVDGKPLLGHVALMLNMRSGNSIMDLMAHAGKLDEGLVSQVVLNHVSGISVLPSPPTISQGQEIQPESLYKVFLELKKFSGRIIIDGGNHLDDNLVTYIDSADYVLLVVNPNLASIRDTRQFLDISSSLLYSKDRTFVVLNKADAKSGFKVGDIEKALHTKVIGVIPVDHDASLSSINSGVPLITSKPNHAISKAVKTLAKSLVELLQVPAKPGDGKGRIPLDILHKSSYRG
jgi:pilus assembly protein CpaE